MSPGSSSRFADASYLAGMLAGAMTKTNVLGVIGGTELPPVKESFAAFTRGSEGGEPEGHACSRRTSATGTT